MAPAPGKLATLPQAPAGEKGPAQSKIPHERYIVRWSRPIFLAAPALEPLFEITALTLVHTKEKKGRQTMQYLKRENTSGVVLSRPIFLAKGNFSILITISRITEPEAWEKSNRGGSSAAAHERAS